jgi:hypothetical protein
MSNTICLTKASAVMDWGGAGMLPRDARSARSHAAYRQVASASWSSFLSKATVAVETVWLMAALDLEGGMKAIEGLIIVTHRAAREQGAFCKHSIAHFHLYDLTFSYLFVGQQLLVIK